MQAKLTPIVLSSLLTVGAIFAAAPPALINYQGVLRDNNDKPLSGSYDMTFRFMDAATGGIEILLDVHAASAGTSPIAVSGGLFNVALGSGALVDGSGPGAYTALDAVFRDYGAVWLEVKVGTETLAPRTRIQSAAYALNATSAATAADTTQLNGQPAGFYLDTSSTQQTKNGALLMWNSDPGNAGIRSHCSGGSMGYGVYSDGCSNYAGYFASDGNAGSTGVYGYGATGVYGNGTTGVYGIGATGVYGYGSLGGQFWSAYYNNYAYVGDGGDGAGIAAIGVGRGGYFSTSTGNYGDFGYYDGLSYDYGIFAHGRTDGAWIENLGTWASVADHTGATIRGNGSKNFVQNHPEQDDRTIAYAALEGDEVGTYTRGSGRLVHGEARVALGETFQWVTNPELGLTVYVAPVGAPAQLYVAEKSTTGIVVKGAPGDPDVDFDYIVVGLRIGFENANVVREKEGPAPVPEMRGLDEQQTRHPELRASTPRARFEGMERGAGRTVRAAYSKADALLGKIMAADHGVTETPASAHARLPGLEAHQREMTAAGAGSARQARSSSAQGADAPGPPLSVGERTIAPGPDATDERRAAMLTSAVVPDLMTAEGTIQPGDVLSLDAASPGAVLRSNGAGDPLVIGCAHAMEAGALPEGRVAVATSHIELCRVDATYGSVVVGDRLVASPTSGAAMKIDPALPAPAVLGRAIDALPSGTGLIRVLVGAR